jgi:hypothetical protein
MSYRGYHLISNTNVLSIGHAYSLFCDIQLSLKYIHVHTGQTEMLCSHLGNAYSILDLNIIVYELTEDTQSQVTRIIQSLYYAPAGRYINAWKNPSNRK